MQLKTIVTLLGILSATSCYSKTANADGNGVAVVELFTSEGCSSCPAAEKVLAQLHDEYNTHNVYLVEFHVGYWNYLGWKDIYSSKDFSVRQQRYVSLMHLPSAYTPQAIVNGKNELVGSDKTKLASLIEENLHEKPVSILQLTAKKSGNNVAVTYSGNCNGQLLNIALVQKKAESDVRKGENSGKKLQHINVVRVLKTVEEPGNKGAIDITMPSGLSAGDCIIIAYSQLKNNWNVTGASETTIQ